jgi:hypothetical protein
VVTAEPHWSWTEALIAGARGTRTPNWPDGFWAGSMARLDAMIRVFYGIYEFTNDPDCILRVAISHARGPVLLADGTRLQPGEPIGTLHCWNEHFPPYPPDGPDLGWACAIRRRVRHSLCELADHVEDDPAWREVRALCAEAALSTRLGWPQVQRVAERYGFERVAPGVSVLRRLHALGESFTLWGLTRAFNPAALPRQPFMRDHHELWISRAALVARYGRARRRRDNRGRCAGGEGASQSAAGGG